MVRNEIGKPVPRQARPIGLLLRRNGFEEHAQFDCHSQPDWANHLKPADHQCILRGSRTPRKGDVTLCCRLALACGSEWQPLIPESAAIPSIPICWLVKCYRWYGKELQNMSVSWLKSENKIHTTNCPASRGRQVSFRWAKLTHEHRGLVVITGLKNRHAYQLS